MLNPIRISSLALALASCAAATAVAQEAGQATVSRVYNDVVAPADQVAYEAGVKAYNKCLGDHGFQFTWTALGHETGNTYMYSYVSQPGSWADFDKMHEADKACEDAWRTNANPHMKSESSAFLETVPDMSHTSADMSANAALVGVTFFFVKHGSDAAFHDAIKKISAASDKAKWPHYYLFQRVRGGDKGSPDYILASWSKNWADYGASSMTSFWKMVEGQYGAQETAALRKAVSDATDSIDSHIDNVLAELTYTAPKTMAKK